MSLCRWVKDVLIGLALKIFFSTGHRWRHSLSSSFRGCQTSVIFKKHSKMSLLTLGWQLPGKVHWNILCLGMYVHLKKKKSYKMVAQGWQTCIPVAHKLYSYAIRDNFRVWPSKQSGLISKYFFITHFSWNSTVQQSSSDWLLFLFTHIKVMLARLCKPAGTMCCRSLTPIGHSRCFI